VAARVTLDRLLELTLAPLDESATFTADDMRRRAREAGSCALWNERAAVLVELDKLAREFDAAGKPNTAKKIRECAATINARLIEPAPGAPFEGERPK
jgi:hypothetical protein